MALERRVSDALGLNVTIEHRGKGGVVHVDYGDLEQLEDGAGEAGAEVGLARFVARMERSEIRGGRSRIALRSMRATIRAEALAMVRYRRNFVPGGTYFFTVTVADRRSSVLIDHIVSLRRAFRITRGERPFDIDAIVVLPDHLHVVMTLPRRRFRFFRALAKDQELVHARCASKAVFRQRRTLAASTICGSAGFGSTRYEMKRIWRAHVDYIHFNPAKHGLVSRVSDWRYSSFHRYMRLGWLPEDWGGTVVINSDMEFGERAGS